MADDDIDTADEVAELKKHIDKITSDHMETIADLKKAEEARINAELAKLDAVEPMDVDVVPSPDSSTASESMASPLCAKVLAF